MSIVGRFIEAFSCFALASSRNCSFGMETCFLPYHQFPYITYVFLEIYKCIFLGEMAGHLFFAYQKNRTGLVNLCKMNMRSSMLNI